MRISLPRGGAMDRREELLRDRALVAWAGQGAKEDRYGFLTVGGMQTPSAMWVKASYLLLQQLDLVLTLVGTSLGLVELNPVMSALLASPARLLAVKLVIPLFIAWVVPARLLVPAIAFLVLVAGWNIRELLMAL